MFTVTISGFKTREEVEQWVEKNMLGLESENSPRFYPNYISLDKESRNFKTNLNKHNLDIDIKTDYSKEDSEYKDVQL